ncbi:MAG: hypothetical protein M0024_10025 [Nitrospiraceae bacterium]|nr:hypothetical protein [Nitrospiraceae bacterium]
MNINSIQAGQLSQNAIRSSEKGDYGVEAKLNAPPAQVSGEAGTPKVSTQAITTGIDYLKDQLQTLLTSFPPFFPAGSPQRLDLIKRIRGLEDQIGKSSVDDNVKKAFSQNKLPENASDHEISASLDRLIGYRNGAKQTEPAKPGVIVNVKV